MSKEVLIIGAGITGVTTAYFAAMAGYKVTVLDRQPNSGLETSYANGGQISVSHAEPWANPGAPKKVLKWLLRDDSPLLFRPKLDPRQWLWMGHWLHECKKERADKNTQEIVKIALRSRQLLDEISDKHNIQFNKVKRGILHYYRDEREFEGALRVADVMDKAGCPFKAVTPSEMKDIEPSISYLEQNIIGGTYTPDDFSGDVHTFTRQLQIHCALSLGVTFRWDTKVLGFERSGDEVNGVWIQDKTTIPQGSTFVPANCIILCAGSFSPLLTEQLDINLLIYPCKGYSLTIDVGDTNNAPMVSLTDDENKLVFSRLGRKLRVAGTAEMDGWDFTLKPHRLKPLLTKTKELFPELNYNDMTSWCGLRPTTPSNIPYVGKTKYKGLLLNTGHGTLGWTMGCGTAEQITEILKNNY